VELSNRIYRQEPLRGEKAYFYCLKARAKWHHCLGYGTFSVEIDELERLRKDYSRRLRPITYLPLLVKATALALERNPEANAILFKKLFGFRIVQFEQVDVNFPVTRKIGERWITFIGTVRNAPAKSLAAIQEEITTYQRCPPEESFAMRRFLRFDQMMLWLARLVHWRMTRDPHFYIRNVGTCGLTLVDAGSWGEYLFPIAPTSVVFGIGSARREAVVRGDNLAIARVLKCVLMADNFIIPGLLGGRLCHDFKNLLETGSFIVDELRGAAAATSVPDKNGPPC
jgi:pyruvate/2-oxoglutarate dehydrogenase complex dihydrolipoamide acyltransferase (E2) component